MICNNVINPRPKANYHLGGLYRLFIESYWGWFFYIHGIGVTTILEMWWYGLKIVAVVVYLWGKREFHGNIIWVYCDNPTPKWNTPIWARNTHPINMYNMQLYIYIYTYIYVYNIDFSKPRFRFGGISIDWGYEITGSSRSIHRSTNGPLSEIGQIEVCTQNILENVWAKSKLAHANRWE